MEKLFITASNYLNPDRHKTKFLAVRYGNVLGSNGSVIPKISEQIKSGEKITITDPKMTRFNITMKEALDLIERATKNGNGGEVFIPKLVAYKLSDLKDALCDIFNKQIEEEIISVRPGEKFHETLINLDELRNTVESDMDYILYNDLTKNVNNYPITSLKEQYSSDNVQLLSKDEIKNIIQNEKILEIN